MIANCRKEGFSLVKLEESHIQLISSVEVDFLVKLEESHIQLISSVEVDFS